MLRWRRCAAFAGKIVVSWLMLAPGALATGPDGGAKTPLAIEDLYRLDGPQAARLDPSGKRLAFVRQWIDPESKQERNSLWLVDDRREGAHALEESQADARAPVFSPDGRWIAFLSTRARPDGWKPTAPVPPESDPATDIWLIRTEGGSSVPLAGRDKPYGRVFNDGFYGRVAFSPDGRNLVFIADDGRDPRTPDEIEAGVLVERPDQGEGYTGYRPAQVWVAELDDAPRDHAARSVERLTDDDVWYGDPQWAPNGRTIVMHANRTSDRESVRYSINKNFDLWSIEIASRTLRQLTTGPGPEVSPRFSPDGKRVACLSIPRKGSHMDAFNLTVVTLGAGGDLTREVFDHHGPGAASPPHPAPLFPLPDECWDGDAALVYNAAFGTEMALSRVALETGRGGRLEPGREGETDISPTRARVATRQDLTPAGNAFLGDRLVAESRTVRWENGEGNSIEGVLTIPHEKVARPPYKLVLFPHGGPHSRSSRGFNLTTQMFGARGYAVLELNFRGSGGYGQSWIDADRGDFGGGDMRDILSGVDHLVRQGLVDRDRQFVYGVSYGGFMTCWLVGHTNRFRAAVAQNAVTDLDVMWGLSDLPSWTEWEFGGRPWDVPQAMRAHSPWAYAASVQTPTLVLHSRDDRRCPLPMGRMFYRALEARGVPTGLVIYPGEGHGIRQPRHRVDVLRRTLAWFERHDAARSDKSPGRGENR
ncbi:MAG: S9 family peptidase [Isosphaeraceae bacterium]|nr:S9 family peptidase [Isosphaeraceae bacterium]